MINVNAGKLEAMRDKEMSLLKSNNDFIHKQIIDGLDSLLHVAKNLDTPTLKETETLTKAGKILVKYAEQKDKRNRS